VERCIVPELAERFGDFVFDFLFIERARQRRFVVRCGGVLGLFPSIVEDDNVQFPQSSRAL
jgi:hypothetical protein